MVDHNPAGFPYFGKESDPAVTQLTSGREDWDHRISLLGDFLIRMDGLA